MKNFLTVWGSAFAVGALAFLAQHLPAGTAWGDWRPILVGAVAAGITGLLNKYHLGLPPPAQGGSS